MTGSLLDSLIAPFAPMPDDEARALIALHYGAPQHLQKLATEKDDTYRVELASGNRFILKISNPAEPETELTFQNAVLDHLSVADAGLPVPRVTAARDGSTLVPLVDAAGQSRYARLLSYLDGTMLDATTASAAQCEQIGRMLARLRHALAGFTHPGAMRIVAWDVTHLSRLFYLLDEVEDPYQHDLLAAAVDRLRGLDDRLPALRRQVLHNDFNRSNLVVDHANAQFVTGVIDFGDAVHTAVAIDVATAMLNQLPRNDGVLPPGDPLAHPKALLRGYLAQADLTDEELALIPHLVMARLVVRALLSLGLTRRFPANARYLQRNTVQGWAQLDWFLQHSATQIGDLLMPLARGQAG